MNLCYEFVLSGKQLHSNFYTECCAQHGSAKITLGSEVAFGITSHTIKCVGLLILFISHHLSFTINTTHAGYATKM